MEFTEDSDEDTIMVVEEETVIELNLNLNEEENNRKVIIQLKPLLQFLCVFYGVRLVLSQPKHIHGNPWNKCTTASTLTRHEIL